MIPPPVLLALSSCTVPLVIQVMKEPSSTVLVDNGLQFVTTVTTMEAVTLEGLSVDSWVTVEH